MANIVVLLRLYLWCPQDPDGYLFELIQREGPIKEPFAQVMLRVGDLDRAIEFYEKAHGMKLLRKSDRPEQKVSLWSCRSQLCFGGSRVRV